MKKLLYIIFDTEHLNNDELETLDIDLTRAGAGFDPNKTSMKYLGLDLEKRLWDVYEFNEGNTEESVAEIVNKLAAEYKFVEMEDITDKFTRTIVK